MTTQEELLEQARGLFSRCDEPGAKGRRLLIALALLMLVLFGTGIGLFERWFNSPAGETTETTQAE